MGINAGALIAPVLTGWLAEQVFGSSAHARLQGRVHRLRHRHADQPGVVLVRPRAAAKASALPIAGGDGKARACCTSLIGALLAIPVIYFLLRSSAPRRCSTCCTAMFVGLCVLLLIEGIRERPGRARQGDRDADHLRLQRHCSGCSSNRPAARSPSWPTRSSIATSAASTFPVGLVPVGELDRDHRARADRGVGVGQAGRASTRRSRASSASA